MAKAIADRVMAEELNGVVYDEEEAKNWSMNISDKVREGVYGKFIAGLLISYVRVFTALLTCLPQKR